MEHISIDTEAVLAPHDGESPMERRQRLEDVVVSVVATHKRNLDDYAPGRAPSFGYEPVLDAGRSAIWKISGEITALEDRGWHLEHPSDS